jgi:serine/threonine protein kinase
MPQEASRVIHGYTLIRRLGDGAFGEVWEATAPGNHPAAVKLIPCTRSQAAAQLELDALEVLKRLNHPHLLPTYASFIDPDQVVIAMEKADGTLRQRLQHCKNENLSGLPIGELLHYMRQAADALDYLHSQKKLHRDVKPDNLLIFLGPPPFIKVGDCGLLREHADNDETMTTLGTPPYMALEVWRRMACAQSDLYSLAVTYVELRQGKRPYNPSPGVSLFDAQLTHDPELDGLEEGEKEVVKKALAKEPQQRHDSCIEFVEGLERALQVRPGSFRPNVKVGLALAKVRTDLPPAPRSPRTEREPAQGTLGGTYMPGRGEREDVTTPSLPPEDSWPPEEPETRQSAVTDETKRPKAPPVGATTWLAAALVLAALGGVGYILRPVIFPPPKNGPPDNDELVEDGPGKNPGTGNNGKENGAGSPAVVKPTPKEQKEADLRLPPGFAAGDDKQEVEVRQRGKFYGTIVRDHMGVKVPFRLVYPRNGENWEPFYLLESKVWNGLYGASAKDGEWKRGGKKAFGKEDVPADTHPNLPVFRVTRDEAEAFARQLGGRLPSAQELDRAAGWPSDEADGPAKPAVGRGEEGPRGVSEDGDVSWAKVRDLRGNGREWTSDTFEVGEAKFAVLRGQRYTAAQPLRYAALKEQLGGNMTPRQDPTYASPYTGFRVVLEVPARPKND